MLFNTIDFFIFFLIVYLVFFIIPHKIRWIWLLISSYVFYMWWNPVFILLILFSTIVDFFVGRYIYSEESLIQKKRALSLSLIVNLGFLGFFKYFNFFQDNIAALFQSAQIPYDFQHWDITLPVGISFYTFQTLSYTIDIYRGNLQASPQFGRFALYVSFFPQLVAGPIERASNLLPQLQKIKQKFQYDNFVIGSSQLIWGLFKKVVVGDALAIYVDSIYNNYEIQSGTSLLLATYAFAFQIYCDFSGYSDMAIGIARMMGFRFMDNFNYPYFSKSITEFWRRWHISLSSWLKDYLYIPLGGNRKGNFNTYKNLLITMLLGGLWHGAAWNFIIWGGLNGLYLGIERRLKWPILAQKHQSWYIKGLLIILTFHLTCFAWIFFRSSSFHQASVIVSKIGNMNFSQVPNLSFFINKSIMVILLLTVEYFLLRKYNFSEIFSRWKFWHMATFNALIIFLILLFGIVDSSDFIYFQF